MCCSKTIEEKKDFMLGILEKLARQEDGSIAISLCDCEEVHMVNPVMDKNVNGIISGEFFSIKPTGCCGRCSNALGHIYLCIGLGTGNEREKLDKTEGIWAIEESGRFRFINTTSFSEFAQWVEATIVI